VEELVSASVIRASVRFVCDFISCVVELLFWDFSVFPYLSEYLLLHINSEQGEDQLMLVSLKKRRERKAGRLKGRRQKRSRYPKERVGGSGL